MLTSGGGAHAHTKTLPPHTPHRTSHTSRDRSSVCRQGALHRANLRPSLRAAGLNAGQRADDVECAAVASRRRRPGSEDDPGKLSRAFQTMPSSQCQPVQPPSQCQPRRGHRPASTHLGSDQHTVPRQGRGVGSWPTRGASETRLLALVGVRELQCEWDRDERGDDIPDVGSRHYRLKQRLELVTPCKRRLCMRPR